MLVRVRATQRGQYAGRIFDPGELLEVPSENLALTSSLLPVHLRPHPDTGWQEPVTDEGRAIARYLLAQRPAPVAHGQLWEPGRASDRANALMNRHGLDRATVIDP